MEYLSKDALCNLRSYKEEVKAAQELSDGNIRANSKRCNIMAPVLATLALLAAGGVGYLIATSGGVALYGEVGLGVASAGLMLGAVVLTVHSFLYNAKQRRVVEQLRQELVPINEVLHAMLEHGGQGDGIRRTIIEMEQQVYSEFVELAMQSRWTPEQENNFLDGIVYQRYFKGFSEKKQLKIFARVSESAVYNVIERMGDEVALRLVNFVSRLEESSSQINKVKRAFLRQVPKPRGHILTLEQKFAFIDAFDQEPAIQWVKKLDPVAYTELVKAAGHTLRYAQNIDEHRVFFTAVVQRRDEFAAESGEFSSQLKKLIGALAANS